MVGFSNKSYIKVYACGDELLIVAEARHGFHLRGQLIMRCGEHYIWETRLAGTSVEQEWRKRAFKKD